MTFYFIGMIIAFILGCEDAKKELQEGNNIEEFPLAIAVITLSSWIYVGIWLYREYMSK